MSILWMDGFEDNLWVSTGGVYLDHLGYPAGTIYSDRVGTSFGRLGSSGLRVGDSANTELVKYLVMSGDTIIIGFALRIQDHGATTGEYLMLAADGGGWQWNIRVDENGTIKWGLSTGSATQSSSPGAVPDQTWCYLEVKIKHSNTVGTVDIKVNGESVLSVSGIDTQATSNSSIDRINIGGVGGGWLHDVYIDDLYILDGSGTDNNDFLGDVIVESLFPDGNGNSSGMTGSDGNSTDNYLLVDEKPVDTSDYVGGSTEGDKDTYTLDNLTAATSDTVYGLMVITVEQKDDAGSKFMRSVVRRGSTDYVSSSRALNTSWAAAFVIWEQDPSTSVAWTVTNINGMEAGQEVRDS
jgi:hypothetical protein